MIKRISPFAVKQLPLTERKTLVVLSPGFPKDEEDSTCLPLQQSLVHTFNRNYPTLKIIILSFQYPYHTDQYLWRGNPVIAFNGLKKRGLAKILLRKKISSVLDAIHSKNKISGLLSFWSGESMLIGKRFAAKHHIKHLCWILGRDALKTNKYPQKLKPEPGELLALSDFLQDEFERNHGIRPLHIVPPGIDSCLFTSLPVERDIDILAAGSLISLKQYEIFISVVAEIKKHRPAVKAMLIGEGPEKLKIEALIHSLGLEANIILAGELAHKEVLKNMQRAKVFLHTSSFEGFGVVCLEALHAGARVFSFTMPMKTAIPHWLFAVDEADMTRKTLSILDDPATEYKSITPFTIDQSAKRVVELFSF